MNDTKRLHDDLKTLEKFSKQLHMYGPDQLRSAVKSAIVIAKEAIEGSTALELLADFYKEECLAILSKDSGFQALPGDELEIKVPGGEEGPKVYRANVASVKGRWREVHCLKEISPHQQEQRRRAKRFPVYIDAEFSFLKDEDETIENAMLLNISKTGLLLATAKPLLLGNALMIMFEINWDDILGVPVGIVGTIVREQKTLATTRLGKYQYCYGVRFKLPSKAA